MYQGLPATDELAKRIVHGGIEAFFGKRGAVFGEARIDEPPRSFLDNSLCEHLSNEAPAFTERPVNKESSAGHVLVRN